jgi:hypothetical protein
MPIVAKSLSNWLEAHTIVTMRTALLIIMIMTSAAHSQGVINIQSGTGVPTDMGVGALLGALLAPMISKGSDAKLVGGLLGAAAGGAYGTAQMQQQQAQSQHMNASMAYQMQLQQQQIATLQRQMAHMDTSGGSSSEYQGPIKMGIGKGKMVKSPYSNFSMDPASCNMTSGEVVYDPINGKPFRLP